MSRQFDRLREQVTKATPGDVKWDSAPDKYDGYSPAYADLFVEDDDGDIIILAAFNKQIPEGTANAEFFCSASRLARALCDPGTVERLCRVLHEEQGSDDADKPMLAPYQNSWDTPELKRWQQWSETAHAIINTFAELAIGGPEPLSDGAPRHGTAAVSSGPTPQSLKAQP